MVFHFVPYRENAPKERNIICIIHLQLNPECFPRKVLIVASWICSTERNPTIKLCLSYSSDMVTEKSRCNGLH
jgi:hypothetical protein